MIESLYLLGGMGLGALVTFLAMRQGARLATRAYLGAFPPEKPPRYTPSPEPTEEEEKTAAVVMSLQDMQRTNPELSPQAELDGHYTGEDVFSGDPREQG